MARSLLALPAFFVVLTLAGCSQTAQNQPAAATAGSSDDLTAIHTLRDNYQAAIGSGDPDKVAANFTSDAVVMRDGMAAYTGADAIRSAAQAEFTQVNEMLMLTPEETKVLGGGWALDRGQYMMHITPKAGAGMTMLEGKYLVLMQKQPDGSWKIAREMNNSNSREVPAPAAENGGPRG